MQLENDRIVLGEQAGLLWTWWRGDPLPTLPPLPTFTVAETESSHQMATLMDIPEADVAAMLQEGHRPYVAHLSTGPVGYGWSATNRAAFGEGRVKFRVPATDRYLYYFVTLPAWRGMGIYPRLLQAILNRESRNALVDGRGGVDPRLNTCSGGGHPRPCRQPERFWIVHQLANVASSRGIARAGFRIASKVYFRGNDRLVLVSSAEESRRGRAGAALLGLPLVEEIDHSSTTG